MFAEVDFISCEKNSFVKDGQTINFQRVTFVESEADAPVTVSALYELDFSTVPRFGKVILGIHLQNNRNGYLQAKVTSFSLPAEQPVLPFPDSKPSTKPRA